MRQLTRGQTRRRRLGWAVAVATRVLTVSLLAMASPEAPGENSIPIDEIDPPETITLEGEVHHVQGVDLDDDFIYVSSVDTRSDRAMLHKFTRTGALVAVADLTDGRHYHPGGISLDGESLWIPVAAYSAHSSTRIMQVDKTSLTIISSFTVEDHIGAVTVDAERIYGGNWDAERLYVWDRAGAALAKAANPTRVAYQDMKVVAGGLVAAGIVRGQQSGTIDWLDPQSFQPRQRLPVGKTPTGAIWTREGMAIRNGKLYLLPSDGRGGKVDLYVFSLETLRPGLQKCALLSATVSACAPVARDMAAL